MTVDDLLDKLNNGYRLRVTRHGNIISVSPTGQGFVSAKIKQLVADALADGTLTVRSGWVVPAEVPNV